MKFLVALKWLESYKNKKAFTLTEVNSEEKVKLNLKEGSEGLKFEVHVSIAKLMNMYNKDTKFIISDDVMKIEVNNYILGLGNDIFTRDFQAYIFQSEGFEKSKKYFYRLMCPIKSFFYLIGINVDQKNFFEFNIENFSIHVSIEASDNNKYLLIESKSKMIFNEFVHVSNSILFVLGYLNGDLIKGEEFFFQSEDENWETCKAFFNRRLKKSIKSFQPITSVPKQYSNFIDQLDYDYENKKAYLDKSQIQALTCIIYFNGNYFLAISLLLEIFNNSFITRPSILYVVLEIVVDEIVKIKSKSFIEKNNIINNSLEVLKKNIDKIEKDDYENLSFAISQIDKKLKQNNKKFEEAFKILEIELSIEDRKSLSKRNDFLHGRIIPKNVHVRNEEEYTKLEYHSISQRLFTLISKLLLKNIGFSGHVINHPKMRENQSQKDFEEDYFVKI